MSFATFGLKIPYPQSHHYARGALAWHGELVRSWEAAVATDPQLIATSGRGQDAERDLTPWQRFANVAAVKHRCYASMDGDLIGRMGPRFVDGAAALCGAIDRAR